MRNGLAEDTLGVTEASYASAMAPRGPEGRDGAGNAQDVVEQEEYLQLFERLVERDASGVFRPQLEEILRDENADAHYGLYVDAKTLLDDDYLLGHLLLRYPETMLNLLSRALVSEQERLVESGALRTESSSSSSSSSNSPPSSPSSMPLSIKRNIHARVQWLPGANRKPNISSIRSVDVNAFVQVSGTVTRSGSIKVLEAVRVFECNNDKCVGLVRVFASKHEVGSIIEKPTGPCPTCHRSSSYTELKERAICHDYQELKIQEQVQKLGMGSIPRSITVLALHDLVDKCKAGDDVVITGVPISRWSATYVEERCNLETVIDANTISVVNASSNGVLLTEEIESKFRQFWRKWARRRKRPMHARNLIVGSICPQVYGMFTVKLAVALSLVGSPAFVDRGGTRVRGEPHLLLVGDPGTGKSQFLRYAAKLAPRSVLTTGTGTTSAGLTCSAVKEGHEFMLEAGALVLADRGVCCIDEFGSIRQHDRATIHEAMEQQTLSVAKAGLVCSLKTRTTLIAATNPRGRYDSNESLSTNTGIAPPLLSRFDMVLILLDRPDPRWDQTVSEFILRAQAGLSQQIKSLSNNTDECDDIEVEDDDDDDNLSANAFGSQKTWKGDRSHSVNPGLGLWNVDTFQAYLTFLKRFNPQLTPEAGQVLTAYYKAQRSRNVSGGQDAGRTTLRLLEALIRLAKAHARLMARQTVVIMDAVVSIILIEESMRTPTPEDSLDDMSFPEAPEEDMLDRTLGILQELGLGHLEPIAKAQHVTAYMLDLDYTFDIPREPDQPTMQPQDAGNIDSQNQEDSGQWWDPGQFLSETKQDADEGSANEIEDDDAIVEDLEEVSDDDPGGISSLLGPASSPRRRKFPSSSSSSQSSSPTAKKRSRHGDDDEAENGDQNQDNLLDLPTQCNTSRLKRKPLIPGASSSNQSTQYRRQRVKRSKKARRSRKPSKSTTSAGTSSAVAALVSSRAQAQLDAATGSAGMQPFEFNESDDSGCLDDDDQIEEIQESDDEFEHHEDGGHQRSKEKDATTANACESKQMADRDPFDDDDDDIDDLFT